MKWVLLAEYDEGNVMGTVEYQSYSFQVGGTEDAANVTEVSEQQTDNLCRPLLMMRTDVLQGGQLPLNSLQIHLETSKETKRITTSLRPILTSSFHHCPTITSSFHYMILPSYPNIVLLSWPLFLYVDSQSCVRAPHSAVRCSDSCSPPLGSCGRS